MNRLELAIEDSDKTVAASRYRLDVPRVIGRIAKGSPQFVDRRIQPMFEIDERSVGPELLAQFLTTDKIARFGDEKKQNLERLTGEADTPTVLGQFTGVSIHLKRSKYQRSGR